MQVLIYKAGVQSLRVNPYSSGIAAGNPVELRLGQDGVISVLAMAKSRWLFGIGKTRLTPIGQLGEQATNIIRPYLDISAKIRVRIVEVEPSHLKQDQNSGVYVSVWGEPEDIRPAVKT